MADTPRRDLQEQDAKDAGLATIRCPHCRQLSEQRIPVDACLYFYDCPRCKARLKPKPGDCCVFCSYGDRRCPSAAAP
jgi:hypothetical protein